MVMRFHIVFVELFLHGIAAPELAVQEYRIVIFCLPAHLQTLCKRLVQIVPEAAVVIAVAAVAQRDLFILLDLRAVGIDCAAFKEVILHLVRAVIAPCIQRHALLRKRGRPVAGNADADILREFQLAALKHLNVAGALPFLALHIVIGRIVAAADIEIRIEVPAVLPAVILIADHIDAGFLIKEIVAVRGNGNHFHIGIIRCILADEIAVGRNRAEFAAAVLADRADNHALVYRVIGRSVAAERDFLHRCELVRVIGVIANRNGTLILLCCR